MAGRLQKELTSLQTNGPDFLQSVESEGSELFLWNLEMKGPEDSPYKDGVFQLQILFPEEYPLKPPAIQMKTQILHPNVSASGTIEIDLLDPHEWKPSLKIVDVIQMIFDLLAKPNNEDPIRASVGAMMNDDFDNFLKEASESTKLYASGEIPVGNDEDFEREYAAKMKAEKEAKEAAKATNEESKEEEEESKKEEVKEEVKEEEVTEEVKEEEVKEEVKEEAGEEAKNNEVKSAQAEDSKDE